MRHRYFNLHFRLLNHDDNQANSNMTYAKQILYFFPTIKSNVISMNFVFLDFSLNTYWVLSVRIQMRQERICNNSRSLKPNNGWIRSLSIVDHRILISVWSIKSAIQWKVDFRNPNFYDENTERHDISNNTDQSIHGKFNRITVHRKWQKLKQQIGFHNRSL